MKLSLLPLVALALAAGACSNQTASRIPDPFVAVPAGTLETVWGAMPTYQAKGGKYPLALARTNINSVPTEFRAGNTAVLDLLVDRTGAVRGVKVHKSSGIDTVDHFLMLKFVGARSLLEVAATDPAPYVLRQTFKPGTPSTHGMDRYVDDHYSSSKFSDISPMGQGAKHPMDR